MDETGGLAPGDVFAILFRIGVGLLLLFMLLFLIDRGRIGEVFVGLCILFAGHMVARAIRDQKK